MIWHLQSTAALTHPDDIFRHLVRQRGLTLTPQDPLTLTPQAVGLEPAPLKQIVSRLNATLKTSQPILIYGDYDADGITATAILWECLHSLGARVYPFIPDREKHGYGLSIKGIQAASNQYQSLIINHQPLIISVDNGITATEAAAYLKQQNIPLIITDHHQPGKDLPQADTIVHTQQISGAGVAWMLARALKPEAAAASLDLVTIGTVADLLPLTGPNRSIVAYGLQALSQTKRIGLQALYTDAQIAGQPINTYHIGYVIAPRLNAMGRLAQAMDSLRLLLTANPDRAQKLAASLGAMNRDRQDLTQQYVDQAIDLVGETTDETLIIVDHPEFHEGVIGLVAGKLVEKHYRPAIVISRRKEISKASARSVAGVNIIELIRSQEELLVSAGGHPMAAGFSLITDSIKIFRQSLQTYARSVITPEQLTPKLDIDLALSAKDVTRSLYDAIEQLQPFGIGNPRPLFAFKNLTVNQVRTVGRDNQHLKLTVDGLDAIGFNWGYLQPDIIKAGKISLAASLDLNTFNGKSSLQLNIKDLSLSP
jgi:single-stranded-DNA-specific exonuclease